MKSMYLKFCTAFVAVFGLAFGWVACIFLVLWLLPQWICTTYQRNANFHIKDFPYGQLPTQDYRFYTGYSSLNFITEEEIFRNAQYQLIENFKKRMDPFLGDYLSEKVSLYHAFSSNDRLWLEKELKYQTKCQNWQNQWKFLRMCLKGCVPLIGILWVLATEKNIGKSCEDCEVCLFSPDLDWLHWNLPKALRHHLQILNEVEIQKKLTN